MAEEVLVGVTGEILKNLISLVTEEINLAWGLKGDLKRLSQKLTMIQAVLHDAEKRQVREESVRVWLKNLKGVAYDAEDVLDEFAYEILRRKMEIENRVRSKVRNFFSISNPIAFRFKMARRVKNINSMLAQIAQEADEFKLEKVEPTDVATNCGEILQTHPHVDDSRVVGRNVDVQKIVDMLLNSDDEGDLSIVAIVGKTTLAQLVYKNEVVTRHFSERVWVCVSHDFDVGRILKEMVESLTRESCDISNIGAMIEKLKEILDQKKCLIVFDDVWDNNSQKWESLRNSLLGIGASRGSKVIVTTRSDEVVSAIPTTSLTYRLIVLSDDDSWILFKQRAFSSGGAKETPNLVDIGRRIVKMCKGLPLAITTLGALMHSKKEEHEWLSIQNSAIWNLPKGKMEILPVLRLSFDHLPSPYLKQCFAYLSFFSKGFKIEKEELIQHWMAQGFLQPSQGRDCEMENIGDEYFKNLLWNSLTLQDLEVNAWDQETTKCMIHDLVHDLAIFVSRSQRGEVNDNVEAQPLLLCPNGDSRPTIPKESARKKRSLALINQVPTNSLLNFKWLRVLIFRGANIKKLPTSIGKLKHLRYLDISYSAIQAFPESLDELYNLQTLRLKKCSIELPKNLRKLINLRHIYFDGQVRPHRMPIEMGRLTCFQTLPLFFVGSKRGRQIEELGSLKKLSGRLRICNLEHVKDEEEAKTANLLEKKNLHKLEFVWNPRRREGDNNDEDVLEGLQPPPNLKRLWIENFGGDRFPSWMMRMGGNSCGGLLPHNNLVEVRLKDCYKCEKLPTLGQLPCLRFLVVHGMGNVKRIGPEFYSYMDEGASGNNGGGTRALFPALKRLLLFDLCNLVEWKEARAMPAAGGRVRVFPCLEKLELLGCPKLTSAPTHFPLLRELTISDSRYYMPLANMSTNLTTLTFLSIKSMSDLTSLPEGLLQNNKNLACLMILQCEKLRYLPDELHNLVSLEKLSIGGCPHLESIPSIHGLTSLRILNIEGCPHLESIPSGLQSCTFLEILGILGCPNIRISIVESDLRELRSLSTLSFIHCGKLERLPEGLRCFTCLKSLGIGGFREELDSLPNFEEILQFEQLRDLRLYGWPKLKSLPHQLQHLTALTSLSIIEFDGVEALPEWLGNLSSLKFLHIWKCKTLMYLPPPEAMRRLTKLRVLIIKNCPRLKIRCSKGSGPEWFKISHIWRIEIDSEVISSDDQFQAAGRLNLK